MSNSLRLTKGFIAAGAALVAALIANVWPPRRSLPWLRRLQSRGQRRRFADQEKPGWECGNQMGMAANVLLLSGPSRAPLNGFRCEVHGPGGEFVAYSPEAQEAMRSASRPSDELITDAAPATQCFLRFPSDFEAAEGGDVPDLHQLVSGRYNALWWTWQRIEGGLSRTWVPVAQGRFELYQAAGPAWRKWLAQRRFERYTEVQFRKKWGKLPKLRERRPSIFERSTPDIEGRDEEAT